MLWDDCRFFLLGLRGNWRRGIVLLLLLLAHRVLLELLGLCWLLGLDLRARGLLGHPDALLTDMLAVLLVLLVLLDESVVQ
jgi:hypothetical protein